MEALCNKSSHFFLRPSEKWIQLVHQSKNASFADIYDAHQSSFPTFYEDMKGSTQATKVTIPLKRICFENIVVQQCRKTSRNPVNFDKHPLKDRFVGPLRKEISRKDLDLLRKENYWVAEKSDSIRVMLLNLHRSRFPRWSRKIISGPKSSLASNLEKTFSLKDNCALETTYCYATNGEIERQIMIRLEDGEYQFDVNNLTLKKFDPNQMNYLDHSEESEEVKNIKPTHEYQLERKFGWSFTYLIDENYDFYLCQDEFIFPTYESMKFQTPQITHQSVLLLDGELIFSMREKRYYYMISDIITYSISNPQKPTEIAVVSALHRSTSEKKLLISKYVMEPHYYFYKKKEPHIPLPRSMVINRKKFFEKSHIDELLSLIHKDETTKEYYFKDVNKTSGIIFIPESERLNIFGPGVCESNLEWKWPKKRFYKFSIKLESYEEGVDSATSISMQYALSVVIPPLSRVSIEQLPIRTCEDVDLSQLNADNIQMLLAEDRHVIARMSLEGKVWKVHELLDEPHPDSFKSIINNYLRQMESISIEEITRALKGEPQEDIESQDMQYIIAHMIRREITVHLRIKTKYPSRLRTNYESLSKPYEDILLQTYHVVKGRDNWVWRKVCSVKDCIGPNGETGDELGNLLYHREQRQRQLSFARCVYLPKEGKWKIVDLSGWEEECSCSRVLTTLEKMVVEVDSIRHRSQTGPSDNSQAQ